MIKKIVLDVLKPQIPIIIDLAHSILKVKGVKSFEVIHVELDREVEKVKAVITGNNLNFLKIKKSIEEIGGVIHSIDGILAEKD
ncbi:MAG: DUF211 domain-containing protein [Candidatus Aenigmarchaeota archaeon]|nr:DUF211 domain-containing protein [Candidatus Aenigmarchaeota archaeon]MDW8149406.1 DUF211 domain-containing protein [Candidatus Aenigmarchaeota archaeon]